MTKHIVLDFEFEEREDKYDEGWIDLVLVKIKTKRSDFTDGEREGLGDSVGQTDKWQLDRWIDIQSALTAPEGHKIKVDDD